MTEQELDSAHISSALQEMDRESVPLRVRGDRFGDAGARFDLTSAEYEAYKRVHRLDQLCRNQPANPPIFQSFTGAARVGRLILTSRYPRHRTRESSFGSKRSPGGLKNGTGHSPARKRARLNLPYHNWPTSSSPATMVPIGMGRDHSTKAEHGWWRSSTGASPCHRRFLARSWSSTRSNESRFRRSISKGEQEWRIKTTCRFAGVFRRWL
jgi:hypothetical protein